MEDIDASIKKEERRQYKPLSWGRSPETQLSTWLATHQASAGIPIRKKAFPRDGSLFARIIYSFAMWLRMKMELSRGA